MAQFTIYRSSDIGAPRLTATSGSLMGVLTASLVTGYGSQPAAGWTCPFSGSNKVALRQGGGNQFYLQVYDNAPLKVNDARIRGYESMTDVDTGSGLFPSFSQRPVGIFVRKTNVVASGDITSSRDWLLAADDRTFYLFTATQDTANVYFGTVFGDFYSFVPNDGYRTMIISRILENSAALSNNEYLSAFNVWTSVLPGHYIARGHYGLGIPIGFGKAADAVKGSSYGHGNIPFTNPANGGLYLSNVWISDPTTTPINGARGRMRGFWQWLHPVANINDGDTFVGTGDLAGKTFLIIKFSLNSDGGSGASVYVIETSNTLETN